jgi:hypothetical protein
MINRQSFEIGHYSKGETALQELQAPCFTARATVAETLTPALPWSDSLLSVGDGCAYGGLFA